MSILTGLWSAAWTNGFFLSPFLNTVNLTVFDFLSELGLYELGENGLKIRRVATNKLNKLYRTADKGWFSAL